MNPADLFARATFYREGLLNDVVPFWSTNGFDDQFGGIVTAVDRDGTWIDTDKGMWQQGRYAWLLGRLYNDVNPNEVWKRQGLATLDFIEQHGFDPSDGRMWFQVTRDGQPLRKRRYAFSESFAAIAFAQWYRATKLERYRQRSIELFHEFVRQMSDPAVADLKFTPTRPTRGLGFPMILLNTAQELRQAFEWEDADRWIIEAIETIETYHVCVEEQAVLETVALDGSILDHAEGRTLNPGHAIEGAWFVLSEARHRSCPKLRDLGCRMLDMMWARGWDEKHGGLLYFVDLRGKPVQEYWHDMKFWWPHNEAILATLLAALLTEEPRYFQWYHQVHDWAHAHFADPEFGEWLGYLHRDGSPSVLSKGTLWKGPFHLPRMQLFAWKWIESTVAQPGNASFAD